MSKKVGVVSVILFTMMAVGASAATITFNTTAGTQFTTGGLTLNSSSGVLATLVYTPNASVGEGVPSNIDLGDFLLACGSCGALGVGPSATFSPFTFDLVVTDSTDGGATGTFVGSSAGGMVYNNQSGIVVTWAPVQLGPGGLFNTTYFLITNPTGIVAPNSGSPAGDTTVQGYVSAISGVPEPTTLFLMGAGLLGLAGLGRRKRST